MDKSATIEKGHMYKYINTKCHTLFVIFLLQQIINRSHKMINGRQLFQKTKKKQMNNNGCSSLPWDPPLPSEAGTRGFSEQEGLSFYLDF